MFGRLRTITLSVSALWQLSSAVPADPTITPAAVLPRQNSDKFIGYLEFNNTWTSLNCEPGLTWYQSGQYAQCCPETLAHCYAPTACVRGSQIYTYPDISSVRTIACTENYNNAALSICNTIFIYENSQDSNPRTNINCGDSSANWSYYRDIPTTEEVNTSPATSIPQLPSTTVVGPTQPAEPKSGSKAWIAGAVVGPILGLALVGAGVWFLLRRRKKAAQVPQQGTASMAPIDPSQPPAGVGGYTDAKPQFQPAQPTYYNQPGQPDPYAQQEYLQQGGFSPPQGSPAPQYGFQSAYNDAANPLPGTYAHDAKHEAGGAAELGGDSTGNVPASPQPDTAQTSQAIELSGANTKPHGEGLPGGNKPQ
ncbi:hypothetical protein BU25DRAFT_237116 [Macroventuria anomochaeta]|uniref:Uncharacterized protein n=1 Tax=Macroventuria anomochaeta TaxID=301207 RepID=A0ACB6RI30_9PLEO|nr:uncharacterized protein BU25DRAFT_237116 [Macroventuria anomochaeta]KAF2621541.1 hypothetical protein BU25DRAFT_237116 [Macroventuria anomochaeta]